MMPNCATRPPAASMDGRQEWLCALLKRHPDRQMEMQIGKPSRSGEMMSAILEHRANDVVT